LAIPGTAAAFKVTAGTDIPVVYTPISDPVGAGFAESYTNPGGNMTGIRVGGFVPKNLEWLTVIAPDTKKVYAPYNPKDQAAVYGRDLLFETAAKFGIEVVSPEAASADDIPAMLAEMPEDVDAIFILTDSMILSRIDDFVLVSKERKIPVTSFSFGQVNAGAVMAFGPNFVATGSQAAGLADQILKGADAGSLPVEESEYFLYLNQAVANELGITLPDQALNAAEEIVR
jgi:putative ABC transport system substrate-binding protein